MLLCLFFLLIQVIDVASCSQQLHLMCPLELKGGWVQEYTS